MGGGGGGVAAPEGMGGGGEEGRFETLCEGKIRSSCL